MPFLSYLFWPNPGNASYAMPKIQLLLALCAVLILGSFALSYWRRNMRNPVTRKLSGSWPSAALWFGISALVFTISRVESIQFLAMRALWIIWALLLAVYVIFQFIQFSRRHYTVVAKTRTVDVRDRYLPKKKK